LIATSAGHTIRLDAPAKVNLYLEIVGRRDDGYHLLDSLVAFTETGDVLAARASPTLGLAIDGPFAAELDAGSDNLVLRAARLLADTAGAAPGAALTLTKNLPIASGIGGGSADAAAALRLLELIWAVTLDDGARHGIAIALGADVPVCLFGRPALVSGIGERIAPAPLLPAIGVVLANPRVAVPTPAVFAARRGPFAPSRPLVMGGGGAAALLDALADRRNDLTEAAITVAPVIADVLRALAASEGCRLARLSGSGATCFALYDDGPAAEHAAAALAKAFPAWWIAPTRFRDQAPAIAPL